MDPMWGAAIVGTFVLSWGLVLPVRKLAWRIGAVDVPKDWRRMHTKSLPRDGGIAFFAALCAGCLIFCRHTVWLVTAMKGSLILAVLGLADDVSDLPAHGKFAVQIFAALLSAVSVGIRGWQIVFAVLWILLLTNAHNFVDGLDGLFGGTAVIEGGMLFLLFLTVGSPELALPALLISAACAGFLCFNRPPASIFAGDCGSGSIGFFFGVLSLPAFTVGCMQGLPCRFAPLLIFAYPLTDLFTAVLRRVLRGKSPFSADRAHLHHRICAAGIPHPMCTMLLLSLSASLGSIGVCLANDSRSVEAIACIVTTIFLMTRIRYFLIHFAEKG